MMLENPFQFDTLVWRWPIAVYLFLVGISVGSVTLAVLLKRKMLADGEANLNAVVRSAAILGPVAVSAGLILLIFDLARPWAFWKLMLFYQWSSIMAIGVMLFQIYMAVLVVWIAGVFRAEIFTLQQRFMPGKLTFLEALLKFAARQEKITEPLLLLLAAALGAYTGFLLAALKSYPMLNNPVLPVLFLVSGLSSGVAASILLSITVFKEDSHSPSIAFLHRFEMPFVLTELFLLFCFFVGLYYGGGQKTLSLFNALSGGFWANVFWYGVLGLGILLPMLINLLFPSRHGRAQMLLVCTLSLVGIFSLRFFVLYGGQLTTI